MPRASFSPTIVDEFAWIRSARIIFEMEGVYLVVHTMGMLGGSEAAAEGINGVMKEFADPTINTSTARVVEKTHLKDFGIEGSAQIKNNLIIVSLPAAQCPVPSKSTQPTIQLACFPASKPASPANQTKAN